MTAQPDDPLEPSPQRRRCAVPTTCQPPSAWCKDPWPATIRDIGTAGMSLTLNRRFERGSGLAIELPGEDSASATVLARVTNVGPFAEGGWLLGCEFISELSQEEVQLVLDREPAATTSLSLDMTPPPAAAAPTVSGVLFQARYRFDEVLRWYVKRLDLSGGWPLERGKVISVRVGGVPAGTPPIEMSVRDCRRYGSFWIVDGKLVSTPADVILRALTTAATL